MNISSLPRKMRCTHAKVVLTVIIPSMMITFIHQSQNVRIHCAPETIQSLSARSSSRNVPSATNWVTKNLTMRWSGMISLSWRLSISSWFTASTGECITWPAGHCAANSVPSSIATKLIPSPSNWIFPSCKSLPFPPLLLLFLSMWGSVSRITGLRITDPIQRVTWSKTVGVEEPIRIEKTQFKEEHRKKSLLIGRIDSVLRSLNSKSASFIVYIVTFVQRPYNNKDAYQNSK